MAKIALLRTEADLPRAPGFQQCQQNLRSIHYAILSLLSIKHILQELLHTFLPVGQHRFTLLVTFSSCFNHKNTHF